MVRRLSFLVRDDSIRRLLAFGVMLLFVFTADAVMSYWVPTFIQRTLSSSLLMGLVMAFSSMVGLLADVIFPQLIRGTGLKVLIGLLLVASLGFSSTMLVATWVPIVILMLLGMAIWGIYYEIFGFAGQQFVASNMGSHQRATAWGILGIFKSLAYVAGPVIAGWALARGDQSVLFVAGGLTIIGVVLFMFMRFHDHPTNFPHQRINLWSEVGHWRVLIKHVWPVLLLSVSMGLVDATFWTTGTVWSEKLAALHGLGGLFLSAYIFPSLFIGLIVARMGIYKHKKKIATFFLLLSNVALIGLGLSREIWWQLGVVLASSVLSGFAYPLVDAVYTDIVARMGREREHLIGLSNSTFSLAYIIGPVLAGLIAGVVGEQQTFVVVGLGAAVVSFIVLVVTPRKLKIPAAEVATWKD
jgi:MFS family permease